MVKRKQDDKAKPQRREDNQFTWGNFVQSTKENPHLRPIAEIQKKPAEGESSVTQNSKTKTKFTKKWIAKATQFSRSPERSLEVDQEAIKTTLLEVWMAEQLRLAIPKHPKTALVTTNEEIVLNDLTEESPSPLLVRSEKLEDVHHIGSEKINFNLANIDVTNLSAISIHSVLHADGDFRFHNTFVSGGKIYGLDHDKKGAHLVHKASYCNYDIDAKTLQALPNLVSTISPADAFANKVVPETYAPAWWLSDKVDKDGNKITDRINTTQILNLTAEQCEQLQQQKLYDFLKIVATPDDLIEKIYNEALSYDQIANIKAKYRDEETGELVERSVLTEDEFDKFRQSLFKDDCERRKIFVREVFKLPGFVEFYNEAVDYYDSKFPESAFNRIANEFLDFQKNSKSGNQFRYYFGTNFETEAQSSVAKPDLTRAMVTLFAGEAKLQYENCDNNYLQYLQHVQSLIRDNENFKGERRRYNRFLTKLFKHANVLFSVELSDTYDNYKILYMFSHLAYQFSKNKKPVEELVSLASKFNDKKYDLTRAVIEHNFVRLAKAEIKNSVRNKLYARFNNVLKEILKQPNMSGEDLAKQFRIAFINAWATAAPQHFERPILRPLQEKLATLDAKAQYYLLYSVYSAFLNYDEKSSLIVCLKNALGLNFDPVNISDEDKLTLKLVVMELYELIKKQDDWMYRMQYQIITFLNDRWGWFHNRRQDLDAKISSQWDTIASGIQTFSDSKKESQKILTKTTTQATSTPENSFVTDKVMTDGNASGSDAGGSSSDEESETPKPETIKTTSNTNRLISSLSSDLGDFSKTHNEKIYPQLIEHMQNFFKNERIDQQTKQYFLWLVYEATTKTEGEKATKLAKFLQRELAIQISNIGKAFEMDDKKRPVFITEHFTKNINGKFNDVYNYSVTIKNQSIVLIKQLLNSESENTLQPDLWQQVEPLFRYVLYKQGSNKISTKNGKLGELRLTQFLDDTIEEKLESLKKQYQDKVEVANQPKNNHTIN